MSQWYKLILTSLVLPCVALAAIEPSKKVELRIDNDSGVAEILIGDKWHVAEAVSLEDLKALLGDKQVPTTDPMKLAQYYDYFEEQGGIPGGEDYCPPGEGQVYYVVPSQPYVYAEPPVTYRSQYRRHYVRPYSYYRQDRHTIYQYEAGW